MRGLAALILLVGTGGCRRHQAAPAEEPAAPPVVAPPPVAPPPAAAPEPSAPPVVEPTAPSAPQYKMPDGGTINGDPRGPRAAEFNRVVAEIQPRLGACFGRVELAAGEWNVTVHYVVEPPGYTGGVTVRGNAPQAIQDCARQVVENMKFPEFRGHKVEQDLPISVKRTDKATRTEVWDAGPQP
jgi:hypothetical protein